MNQLFLLFTKEGLHYQLNRKRKVLEEEFYPQKDSSSDFDTEQLDMIVKNIPHDELSVISAYNHFALTPMDFTSHELGYDLIQYNAPADRTKEELMVSINTKYEVQFYYTLPKSIHRLLKASNKPSHFNFSGEKFLNSIQPKNKKEIHIHLYHGQCEFIALENKKVVLYNNLDVNSEVDFLYFILFTASKIDFHLNQTDFYIYGETTDNETFIEEFRKFVPHFKILVENIPGRNFILNY